MSVIRKNSFGTDHYLSAILQVSFMRSKPWSVPYCLKQPGYVYITARMRAFFSPAVLTWCGVVES